MFDFLKSKEERLLGCSMKNAINVSNHKNLHSPYVSEILNKEIDFLIKFQVNNAWAKPDIEKCFADCLINVGKNENLNFKHVSEVCDRLQFLIQII